MKFWPILTLFCVVLGCDLDPAKEAKPIAKKAVKKKLVPIKPQVPKKQQIQKNNTVPQASLHKNYVPHAITIDPASEFLKRFFRSLKYANKASQQMLNDYLRQLENEGGKYTTSNFAGDIHNLAGRFYYYKIALEHQENRYRQNLFFQKNWVKIWRQQAAGCFEKARLAYLKPNALTCMNLPLKQWMGKGKTHSFINYENTAKAADDMLRWLDKISD